MPVIETYGPNGIESLNFPDDVPQSVLNEHAVKVAAARAIGVNSAFLAIGSPSNAQTVAQVKILTRECNALIRLLLDQLDSTVDI